MGQSPLVLVSLISDMCLTQLLIVAVFMIFVVLCPGAPEGSTGSGSGFKASQKTL